jgi:hypothetical protein
MNPLYFKVDVRQRKAITGEGKVTKKYAVRAAHRISTRHPFLYHGEGFHGKGRLWDLSVAGWRATGDPPVTQGMMMPVYIELPPDEGESKYLLIDSAIVRWSSGHDAGWEIQTISETSRDRLNRFLDRARG